MNSTAKMKKEISEYIVAHVLDHSDILIRGSQKRQNYDNEMRQELWTNLANKLAEVFDAPMEPEKVKQHFHNRRKAVMGRVRDDLKRNSMENATVEEKMEWIRNRKLVTNDYDLQIIEFFFNKEEERGTTPLNTATSTVTTTDFDSSMSFLNGLVKTEVGKCEGEITPEESIEDPPSTSGMTECEPIIQTCQPLYIPQEKVFNHEQPSQLIVEIPNRSELKRLLNLLIDNGFCRFAHLDDAQRQLSKGNYGQKKSTKRKTMGGEPAAKKTATVTADATQKFDAQLSDYLAEAAESDFSALGPTASLLLEMTKLKDEDDDRDEEDDPDIQIAPSLLDIMKTLSQTDGKKKTKEEGISMKCELCSNSVRLNQSGSKWNLYEHVVLNHSQQRPFKCPRCPYAGVRKGRVRQHIQTTHDCEEEPENAATQEIREQWDAKMLQCFPTHKHMKCG